MTADISFSSADGFLSLFLKANSFRSGEGFLREDALVALAADKTAFEAQAAGLSLGAASVKFFSDLIFHANAVASKSSSEGSAAESLTAVVVSCELMAAHSSFNNTLLRGFHEGDNFSLFHAHSVSSEGSSEGGASKSVAAVVVAGQFVAADASL